MRINAFLLLLSFPASADIINLRIRPGTCEHVEIVNSTTGETRVYYMSDFKGNESTDDKYILWARDTLAFESVDTKRMTKYTAKATLEGKTFAPSKYSSEPIAEAVEEPISEPVKDPVVDPTPIDGVKEP